MGAVRLRLRARKIQRKVAFMAEQKPTNLNITAKPEDLKGVYANMSIIASTPSESRIDFIYNDHAPSPDSTAPSYLVSRVILSHSQLVALAKALNEHLDKNPGLTGR